MDDRMMESFEAAQAAAKKANDQAIRLDAIHQDLLDLANGFAGDKTGNVAVALHIAASMITIAKREMACKNSQEMQIIHMVHALGRVR